MKLTAKLRSAFSGDFEKDQIRAYLDRSVSMADLERRQREIDNGRFNRSRFPF